MTYFFIKGSIEGCLVSFLAVFEIYATKPNIKRLLFVKLVFKKSKIAIFTTK